MINFLAETCGYLSFNIKHYVNETQMEVSRQIKHKTVFRLTGKCCQKCHPSHKCSTHGSAFLLLQTNMARYISVTGKKCTEQNSNITALVDYTNLHVRHHSKTIIIWLCNHAFNPREYDPFLPFETNEDTHKMSRKVILPMPSLR